MRVWLSSSNCKPNNKIGEWQTPFLMIFGANPLKTKKCVQQQGCTHRKMQQLVIATTQHFLPIPKYAKIEPAFLPKDKNTLSLGGSAEEMASNLYQLLHDGEKYDCIISFKLKIDNELMLSVNNRFSKAFGNKKN